jgi:adenylate cyclase class 2
MQPEIEAKFLHIDHDEIRRKLRELGAKCEQPMRSMRRKNFDFPDKSLEKIGGWVRLRDEGEKITLAYKQLEHRGVDGTKEVSIVVNSFEETELFLTSIGLRQNSYQETKRESWTLDDTMIELDEWPWIHPFIEVEAVDEVTLFTIAEKLGFSRNDALHGSVEVAYQAEYDVTEAEIDGWPEIRFTPIPDLLAAKRR